MSIERLVVGVDGSAYSVAALEWAVDLSRATGAEVLAVHAVGLLESLHEDLPVPVTTYHAEIRRRFETIWCAPLSGAPVRSRLILRDGPPVLALLAVAEEEHADLLVVGSRGLGGAPESRLGSTSTQLAQRSRLPVTIVPQPD